MLKRLLVVALAVLAAGCGSSAAVRTANSHPRNGSDPSRGRKGSDPSRRLRVRLLGHLPAPVQLPAVAPLPPDGALVMGGLDAADGSVDSIVRVGGRRSAVVGRLPAALHDAAGAPGLFIGGGNAGAASPAVLRVAADGGVRQVGSLPSAASDVAAARVGRFVYVVGGYTGSLPLDTITRVDPSGRARTVARMPRPLRYAAVAAAQGRVVIAGGTTGTVASDAVLSFDPASGRVSQIGRLPIALTHAAAVAVGARVYVLGGRGDSLNEQQRSILAIDPLHGGVRFAGRLPLALSDLSAASLGDHALVVGGRDSAGRVHDEIWGLTQ